MITTPRDTVVALLLRDGATHRADLARVMGVSRTTVTNVVAPLVAKGILSAGDDSAETGTGTPKKQRLAISQRCGLLVSIVSRRTTLTVGIAALDGRLLGSEVKHGGALDSGSMRLQSAIEMVRRLQVDLGLGEVPILLSHVAVNSQTDSTTGEILGGRASAAWVDVNPKTMVEAALGSPVKVENSSRLLAFVEHLAHPEARNLIYAHLTGGVAMGQIINGEIAAGSHGGAGELGHLSIDHNGRPCECGNRGCLGRYVGSEFLEEEFAAILGPGASITDGIAAARRGDYAAQRIIDQTGTLMGEALASVCNLLDPDLIVLGGPVAGAGDLYVEPVREAIKRRALPLITRTLRVTCASATSNPESVVAAAFELLKRDHRGFDRIVDTILGMPH
ncbi:ROK family protein [Tessaracoccus sp. ZS01]|uniref:ROK family transcriptional regulator n=1 Tax=Tessaracoccus sp. ZS01 TaxID=1906324 RepID=UPI001180AD58|nr:ROK family protein [Tessaracoccus sp. ZS01]